jgi:hypothetical protein
MKSITSDGFATLNHGIGRSAFIVADGRSDGR